MGNLEKVLKLISAGANLDLQDEYGNIFAKSKSLLEGTALIMTSWKGQIEISLALISAGANLDLQDKYLRQEQVFARRYCPYVGFLERTP